MENTGSAPNADLETLYRTEMADWLARQDTRVVAAKRNRWIVLFGGLAIAAGILWWAIRRDIGGEILPMIAFGIGLVSIAFFWISTGELKDEVRHFMLGKLAASFGFTYEANAKDFNTERYALLGVANGTPHFKDRLSGKIDGLDFEFAAGRVVDGDKSIMTGQESHMRERFNGLLMRLADPAPPKASFRVVPTGGSRQKSLQNVSRVLTIDAAQAAALGAKGVKEMEREFFNYRGPEESPPVKTGDGEFDAMFELHAETADAEAARARLSPPTRRALIEIAGFFEGAAVSAGFDSGEVLLAFATTRRFEIGPLRPPIAQFERVKHLADQVSLVPEIARRLKSAAG
jgi:hypothetical protein